MRDTHTRTHKRDEGHARTHKRDEGHTGGVDDLIEIIFLHL